jgi:hypothetical protein
MWELVVILVICGPVGLGVIAVAVYMASGVGERRRLRGQIEQLTSEVRSLRREVDQHRQAPPPGE